METKDIEIVQKTWQQMSSQVEEISQQFYVNLFSIAPEVRPLFRDDIRSQALKLKSALSTTIRSLGRIDEIRPVLRGLGQRHVEYGAVDAHYDVVGQALLSTFKQALANDWTADVEKAWTNAYTAIASEMKSAAAEVQNKEPITELATNEVETTVISQNSKPKEKGIWQVIWQWLFG